MRALFIGGTVDNSELDMNGPEPPRHYPAADSGSPRYDLHHVGRRDGDVVYAVYAAQGLTDDDVMRVARERDYSRRFDAPAERVRG